MSDTEEQPTAGLGEQEEGNDSYRPPNRHSPLMYDEDYINNRLKDSINKFGTLSGENQKMYKRYKRAEILIATTIPFSIMLSTVGIVESVAPLRILLLIYSAVGGALLAFMGNVLNLSAYYDRWKNFRARAEVLKREQYLYSTKMPPYHLQDAFPLLVERVEEILDEVEKEDDDSDK